MATPLTLISSDQFNSYGRIFLSLRPRNAAKIHSFQRVSCALSSNNRPENASAGTFMDKYVKKKKLDPLEVYVPAVILTQLQIKDVGKILESDKPEYAICRSLLRSGLASSLRVNIRAVAQYASEQGNGNNAFNNVDQCLRALEELDSSLLRATRNDQGASIESMKANINTAVLSLDRLLQTVPPDVLAKGKVIADFYSSPKEEGPEIEDPELKQLESIL